MHERKEFYFLAIFKGSARAPNSNEYERENRNVKNTAVCVFEGVRG